MKKNRNMKKREIQAVQEEILVDVADKEQRKTTRLGAIIAIVAVIGAAYGFLFKITIGFLNVWSENGIIYWYMQILFLLILAMLIIIFFDIVLYVLSDLKRYNTLAQNYKQYDQQSDNKYMRLLNDFRFYTIMLFFVLELSVPLATIYTDNFPKWVMILFTCLDTVGGIVFGVPWIKRKNKEEVKKMILNAGRKIGKLIIIVAYCLSIGSIFVVNNKATISVNYSAGGIVDISNTSAESYTELNIEIHNWDNKIIYTESVEKEKLLFAREDKYVNNEIDGKKVAEGLLINCERIHWRYILDLKEAITEPGKYYVLITAHQDGKRVCLINSFLVENKEYVFAEDEMEKEY